MAHGSYFGHFHCHPDWGSSVGGLSALSAFYISMNIHENSTHYPLPAVRCPLSAARCPLSTVVLRRGPAHCPLSTLTASRSSFVGPGPSSPSSPSSPFALSPFRPFVLRPLWGDGTTSSTTSPGYHWPRPVLRSTLRSTTPPPAIGGAYSGARGSTIPPARSVGRGCPQWPGQAPPSQRR